MSTNDLDGARRFLAEFVGAVVSSVECDEYQLRLIFYGKSEFVTQSPWRIIQNGNLVIGSGDIKSSAPDDVSKHLKGRKVTSNSVSDCWDTQFWLGNDCIVEITSNSVRYETWEAHLEAGWIVFMGGTVTLFPPHKQRGSSSRSTH